MNNKAVSVNLGHLPEVHLKRSEPPGTCLFAASIREERETEESNRKKTHAAAQGVPEGKKGQGGSKKGPKEKRTGRAECGWATIKREAKESTRSKTGVWNGI